MAAFSVIIPVYNIEDYLIKCLDSIVSQTFTDLEIIIVNDGSTDGCPAICDRYAADDSRIKVIHKINGGLVSARKAGAIVATSDYIACVDGDDWIEEDYFERFANIISCFSPDIICCGTINRSCKGNISYQKIKEQYGYYTKEDIERKIFPHLIDFSGNIWGKVFKKKLYMNVQLDIDERIKMAEDACVVIPCVYNAESLYIIEDCLYNYRYNPSSMTKKKTALNLEEPILIAAQLEKHLDLEQEYIRQQVYISTVHRLFNRCISQFYQKKPYYDICEKIGSCIENDFYQKCINKSRISLLHSPKEWLARMALKNRMFRIMKLYSKVR